MSSPSDPRWWSTPGDPIADIKRAIEDQRREIERQEAERVERLHNEPAPGQSELLRIALGAGTLTLHEDPMPPRVPPLLDGDPTPEDLEAKSDAPRPGVWVGEPGADLRALTQDETDALIRTEMVKLACANEREAVAAACGGVDATMPDGVLLGYPVRFTIWAHTQRGGIDSDPLVRVLARRAWGDRDREWFELRGVRKGDEVEVAQIVPVGKLVTVAKTWHTTSAPPGIAQVDARPGETVYVEWQMSCPEPGETSAIVREHCVSDRLREPPMAERLAWREMDRLRREIEHADLCERFDFDRCTSERYPLRGETLLSAYRDGRRAELWVSDLEIRESERELVVDQACGRMSSQLGRRQ